MSGKKHAAYKEYSGLGMTSYVRASPFFDTPEEACRWATARGVGYSMTQAWANPEEIISWRGKHPAGDTADEVPQGQ